MSSLDLLLQAINAQTEAILTRSDQGNSQQQWIAQSEPKPTGRQMFEDKNRIFAGGTGDIPQRDSTGNITGYKSNPSRSLASLTPGLDRQKQMQSDKMQGKPLATASGTPGLDAFYKMNPQAKPNPLVVTKRTMLPAQNTADMAAKIFT